MFSAFCCAITYGTILVIDDEAAILKMLKLKLIRSGFLVDTAESGEEDLKRINLKLIRPCLKRNRGGPLSTD